MPFLHLHDLNNPSREVLIDSSAQFNIVPASGGTGSMLVPINGDLVIFVHESGDEIETLVEGAK